MSYSVTREIFPDIALEWTKLALQAETASPFVLPVWQQVWWASFGAEYELYLCAVRQGEGLIGVAPLMQKEGKAFFIGSADICDYLDFVILPGSEPEFFEALLDQLSKDEIHALDLCALRPDSAAMTFLMQAAEGRGSQLDCQREDVSLDIGLPKRWERYLRMLSPKQRHEVNRRIRRLEEAGEINYRVVSAPLEIGEQMEIFLDFFRQSHQGKLKFMTSQMEAFFVSMTQAMAEADLLRLGIIEIDSAPAAMVMCFDYKGTIYLYNSGYDPAYRSLSVGLLSKILYIKYGIRKSKKRYDFLKGAEEYKYRLGGVEIPVYNCRIALR